MTVEVSLSIGSNIDREKNIRSSIAAIREVFEVKAISPVYESEAVGFSGSAFYNLIVIVATQLSVSEVNQVLKTIEDAHGRQRSGPKFSSRTLDIDVVTYNNFVGEIEGVELPRRELFYNAFVLYPMIDLLGCEREPKTGSLYRDLRAELGIQQSLQKVPFHIDPWESVS